LAQDAELRLSTVWQSSSTAMRGHGAQYDFSLRFNKKHVEDVTLQFEINGPMIGGLLTVETMLILIDPGYTASPLAPKSTGSILWQQPHTTSLEGIGTRFPVEVIDFSSTNWLPSDASWHLSWERNDLHSTALGNMV